MSRMLYRIGRACFAHRWLVVVTWLLVVIAAGAGMKIGGGQLDNTFTIPGSPSQTALDQVKKDFPAAGGTSAQLVFAARGGTTVTSPANAAAISQALSKAAAAPQVAAVIPPDKSHLVTKDGTTAIGTVQYRVSASGLEGGTLDALSSIASAADSSTLSVQPGGQAFSSLSSGSGSSEVTGLLIAFAVLAVALASLVAAGMPLLTALTGVGVSVLTLHGLAAALSVSNTAVTLAVMIGLAVGVDYALFIVSRHRAQLAAGLSPAESAAIAVGTAGTAVVFAGCTVIIALAALSVVGIPFLTVMGLAAAGTVLTAVLIATTLLPAIFGIAGSRLVPKPGSRAARLASRTAPGADIAAGARPTRGTRWLAAVSRHPAAALTAAVVGLLVLAVPALGLTLALPDNGSAAGGTSQRIAFDTISSTFGPGYNGPLLVLANLTLGADPAAAEQQADAVAAKLKGFPDVAAVTPPQLDQAHTAALIDVVPASAPSAAATATLVTSIRDQAATISHATGASVAVTGTTAIDVDVSARLSAALLPFAGIVVGLSLLLLMLVFRSLIVPVKAAIGFLLSVGASFGATVAVFQWGWLAGPLGVTAGPVASFLPIVLMAVLFGLAMDYEVFLVSRIREDYTRSHDPRHAIIAGGGAAARVVVAAAVIMTCIFASFLLSGDTTIKSLALALAIGVACDALVVRMTIVPAVLALAGQHAWHLPRWLDRALPDLDIEGASLRRPPTPPAEQPHAAEGIYQQRAQRS
ncbi:MAG TPA: MMPL family transporter [Streptosporangiaceae bacterium]|nr:MMPL family transporter [Streptosporangiaceae bacterium]